MWLWPLMMSTQFMLLVLLMFMQRNGGTHWLNLVEILKLKFGRDFEPEYLLRYWRWRQQEKARQLWTILKIKFCQDFEANFSSRLWSCILVKILKVKFCWDLKPSLIKILKLKFGIDLKWCVWWWGLVKNSTLGSVVHLAMFCWLKPPLTHSNKKSHKIEICSIAPIF